MPFRKLDHRVPLGKPVAQDNSIAWARTAGRASDISARFIASYGCKVTDELRWGAFDGASACGRELRKRSYRGKVSAWLSSDGPGADGVGRADRIHPLEERGLAARAHEGCAD